MPAGNMPKVALFLLEHGAYAIIDNVLSPANTAFVQDMMEINKPLTRANLVFHDHALFQRAMTHRSYLNEHVGQALEDNERLEFLGDAVLNIITAQYLYHRFPELREGALTRLRAALVQRETLAGFASEIGLGEYLLLGRGEEESGGRARAATLCDAFEALVGALYLDQGFEATRRFVEPFIQSAVSRILAEDSCRDYRSELQELSQARFQETPRYYTVAERGPDHAKEFVVEAHIGDHCYGRGSGASKQAAAKQAAADALSRLYHAQTLADAEPAPAFDAISSPTCHSPSPAEDISPHATA